MIKQLGTSYYVWPGASHNRFEHCLGVAHLARLMAEHLQTHQPELEITDRDVKCVELAGLCHDLGHGPWSHVWDGQFIPRALEGSTWTHEEGSEMMFDDMVSSNRIDISEADAEFVKALIAGDSKRCGGKEKPFLFEIVANKRNGIDVDKFDYIARDSHAIGEKGNISLTRLIHSARVIDDQICYDIKDANQLYELCYTRFSLHKRIYNHKTAKAIEYMIIDALLAAEPHMKIAEQVFDPERYVYLTDDLMPRIEMSRDPELKESQAIFDRIRTRDLYKCVDYKVFEWAYKDICEQHITPEKIVEAAKNLTNSPSTPRPHSDVDIADSPRRDAPFELDELTPGQVIVDLTKMHYGMKDKNPLDSIKFYSKNNPGRCETAGPGDVSLLMPSVFGEVLLRVYTKDERFFGIVQAGYRAVLAEMPELDPAGEAAPRTQAAAGTNAGITTWSGDRDLSVSFREGTPPPSDATLPVTPGFQTPPRASSTSTLTSVRSFGRSQSGPVGMGLSAGRTISVRDINHFTTVPKNYVPKSPTHGHKRKRSRADTSVDAGAETEATPAKKR
ncbi:HD-domain/PDEase-like protein [Gloeophyllum trabeum ATCC 11539]|uniref:HD-domain/PDEase-like protein n=1 Tax=Gloeophyllum trabeum (strain ATCC 11539 / FP-39264 / Madison 617) TaxID=670483 RepID=S7S204_GLOTA|nr:HD-domain/PDEase-like protein [Gloeophyllum trabeum ATCC 11539]EPQ59809.1 HD-domain/PDEase-like protein [Gloeophyllum trabeum ATCC 11539]